MAGINVHLKRCKEQVLQEIQAIREEGEVAPEGINIVRYEAYNANYSYEYYRLVAKEPIFEGLNGKKTKVQHLGDLHAMKTHNAMNAIKRRKKIKILEKLFVNIEKSLHELEVIED
jgi:hypothetical protein